MDAIRSFFPKPVPRPGQLECVEQAISTLFDDGNQLFIIDAPVGTGKSASHVCIARYVAENYGATSYYLTGQKSLQDQLAADFPEIPLLKGRGNYTCIVPPYPRCDASPCVLSASDSDDPESPGDAKASDCDCSIECPYVEARAAFNSSPVSCTNFAYYYSAKHSITPRKLMIVDEAHSIAEWAVNYVKCEFNEKDFVEESISIPRYRSFGDYFDWIKADVVPSIRGQARDLKADLRRAGASGDSRPLFKRYNHMNKLFENATGLVQDYEEFGEEWVFKHVDEEQKIQFSPVTSARFLSKLLWNYAEKIIVSSATIVPEYFIPEAGLSGKRFDPDKGVFSAGSTFPPELSPIYYYPCGRMSKKYQGTTFPAMVKVMNKIIRDRLDRKGIVHCYAYERAKYLDEHLDPVARKHVVMQDREHRERSLAEWMKSTEPSVFISTKYTEGIDLKDDYARYQIYIKMGFPSLTDPRVKKRLVDLGDHLWYDYQAIEDVEQMSGRATRSDADWSETFVLDTSFGRLRLKYRKYFKNWFLDRLQHPRTVPGPMFPDYYTPGQGGGLG